MNSITYEGKCFWYKGSPQNRILIDLRKPMENVSQIPIIEEEGQNVSVYKLINYLQDTHMQIDSLAEDNVFSYSVLDFLTMRCLMHYCRPVKAVELGAMSGISSFHLGTILGQYDSRSLLCSICNGIGNESGNHWLEYISQMPVSPRLSMLAADYEETLLQEKGFDLVLLHGRDYMEKPKEVIKEAKRLLKPDGTIICYFNNQPELDKAFLQEFPQAEVYHTEVNASCFFYSGKQVSLEEVITEDYGISSDLSQDKLREIYVRLEKEIQSSIEIDDRRRKAALIQLQEKVLDYMYPVK